MFTISKYIQQVVDHVHCILAAVGYKMLKTFTKHHNKQVLFNFHTKYVHNTAHRLLRQVTVLSNDETKSSDNDRLYMSLHRCLSEE